MILLINKLSNILIVVSKMIIMFDFMVYIGLLIILSQNGGVFFDGR
ncbi:hypothetical protein [Parvimonas sp. M20]|nr:hypothetical protein [Parvimonas sp. M20]MEB3025169.1 hypothetical protein [Parvimonas sp. M13]